MSNIIDAARTGDRRKTLAALRDAVADELDTKGHRPGCECECGPVADRRQLATLTKELDRIVNELGKLPGGEKVSKLDELAAAVNDELAPRRARRTASPSA